MSTEQPTVFEGKYEVIGKIAEGGMGAIYKVRHVLLNEIRVIKVMRAQAAEKEEHRKRFVREAQTATKLKHPNIVNFYDFAVDENDTSYMVMEFIDGVTFNQLIRSGGPVPLPIALALARQCLSALGYLHRRGIVHRDVSPDNILMAADEEAGAQAKLIDLGIAKAIQEESLTVGAAFIGKLRYCSPEQLSMGSPLDGRSDLFSFGILLSEMLTGVCPLPGDSAQSILMAHVSGKFLPFEHTDPNGRVPPALREIVDRALQIERPARIQTAEDFSKLIGDFVSKGGFTIPPAELRAFADRAIAARPATVLRPASSGSGLSPLDAHAAPTLKLAQPAPPPPVAVAAEKTESWQPTPAQAVGKAPPRPASSRATLWLAGLGLAVVASVGYWALTRDRTRPIAEVVPTPSGNSVQLPPVPSAVPSPAPPAPTEPPVAAIVPTAREEPPPVPTPRPRPPRPAESAESGPPVTAERFPIAPSAPRERIRYCTTVEPTSYAQATASEKPAGFDAGAGEVFRGPRPDAARITIKVEVSPSNPLEGQPFRVAARLINGGDVGITLARVEESAVRSRGGFQAVPGVGAATVQVGGSLTIYSFEGVLTEGNAYAKDLKVVDSVGDTWKTSIRVSVCPD